MNYEKTNVSELRATAEQIVAVAYKTDFRDGSAESVKPTAEEGRKYKVGDVITFYLDNDEKVEAMAVKQDRDNMIFCFVNCLSDEFPMNNGATDKGGYEVSDLRETLKSKILPRFPDHIKEMLVPFMNGDLLRIPTEKEIFGENIHGIDEPDTVTQWEPMKLRKNRIAFQGFNGYMEWYWLQNPWRHDVVSSTFFVFVASDGYAYASSSSYPSGVRPTFQILNL